MAPPARGAPAATPTLLNPDPRGKINRDDGRVQIETLVTPARVQPGRRVRVRVTFRLRPDDTPWWNNEADGLQLAVKLAKGLQCDEGTFDFALPAEAETRETRVLEFELQVPAGAKPQAVKIPAYALYDVCDDKAGVCLRLRQDLTVTVYVDPRAPRLGR